MFSHWSRPKPNASEGGWVIYSDLQEILLITLGVLGNWNLSQELHRGHDIQALSRYLLTPCFGFFLLHPGKMTLCKTVLCHRELPSLTTMFGRHRTTSWHHSWHVFDLLLSFPHTPDDCFSQTKTPLPLLRDLLQSPPLQLLQHSNLTLFQKCGHLPDWGKLCYFSIFLLSRTLSLSYSRYDTDN